MLSAALEFKDVFSRHQERDDTYQHLPSKEDWEKVEEVCLFLRVFKEITLIISGSEYSTFNLFLPKLWRIKEVLNEKFIYVNEFMKRMAKAMLNKLGKYWGNGNLLIAITAVLDPRNKMKLIEFCFPGMYPQEEASKHVLAVYDALYELYNDYVTKHASKTEQISVGDVNVSSGHSIGIVKAKNINCGRSKFDDFIRRIDTVNQAKSELDIYLDEGVYICAENSGSQFCALEWWKGNHVKFKILSQMARDLLSIPVTTVASESAFSAGGRVIDPYRASLSTVTVQALLCAEDWLRSFYGIKSKAKKMEESKEYFLSP